MRHTTLSGPAEQPAVLLPLSAWLVGAALLAGASLALAAPRDLVSLLGDPAALRFEGCQAIPAESVRQGLMASGDVQLAATPSAPLDDYLATLRRSLKAGYLAGGFPQATADVELDKDKGVINVKVREGQRCMASDVRITGAKAMDTRPILDALTLAPAGDFPVEINSQAGTIKIDVATAPPPDGQPAWQKGKPADFSELTAKRLNALALEGACAAGHFWAKPTATIQPEKDSAALLVDVTDEGPRAIVGSGEFRGLVKSKAADMNAFLGIKPGMPVDLRALREMQKRLWSSGRFMKHIITASRLPEAGKVHLLIDVEEVENAPPIGQDASPAEAAMLKLRDFLADLSARQEDAILSIDSPSVRARITLGSREGIALRLSLVATQPAATQPPTTRPSAQLSVAAILAAGKTGIYLPNQQRKFVAQSAGQRVTVELSLVPKLNPETGRMGSTFVLGGGVQSGGDVKDRPPFVVRSLYHPAVLVREVYREGSKTQIADGVLTISHDTSVLKVEAATGRLLELQYAGDGETVSVRLSFEKGALAREAKALEDEAPAANAHDPGHPVGSFLRFAAEAVAGSGWFAPNSTAEHRQRAIVALAKLLPAELFAALDKAVNAPPIPELEQFHVPLDPATLARRGPMATMACVVLPVYDLLMPRGSWPWTLARETTLVIGGMTDHTNLELARLYGTDDIGPLGYLLGAELLTRVKPAMSRVYAERGLEVLTEEGFQKDCRALLQGDSVQAQVLGQLVANVRSLDEKDVEALSAILAPSVAGSLKDLWQGLKSEPDKPVGELLGTLQKQIWKARLKEQIETRLRQLAEPPKLRGGGL